MFRVSIIDDESDIRERLARRISRAHEFTCVAQYADCESALKNLLHDKPDIVLMDLEIPGHMSGIEGTARMKEIMPQLEIIALTSYSDDNHLFPSLRCGASGYLLKDTDQEEVVQRLKEHMDAGATMNMSIARKVIEYFHTQQPAEPLTSREQEVLAHLMQGETNEQIADKLYVDISTVKFHNKNIFRKMHVSNRIELLTKGRSPLPY